MIKINPNDIVGSKINRLTVLKYLGKTNNIHKYSCKCICGVEKILARGNLVTTAPTQSCGCKNIENITVGQITHGQTRTKLYWIFYGMKARCYNKNHKQYKDYGGRGITIYQEWLDDFGEFSKWAFKNGYKENCKLSIERKDNNSGYNPYNCEWVKRSLQNRNQRSNRLITYQNITKPLIDWAEDYNIPYERLKSRLNRGWDVHTALTKPKMRQGGKL